SDTSQNFRLAVTDTPSAARVSTDAAPGTAAYTGYAMFMNMATTFGRTTSFVLDERTNPGPAGSGAFLGTSSDWTQDANSSATTGQTGYASGTQYTFVMSLTRNASNGLDITSTMSGGNIGNTGSISVSFTDATPNSSTVGGGFTFDTFGIRPSS